MSTDPARLGEAGVAFVDALQPGADERGVVEDQLQQLASVLPPVYAWAALGQGEGATLVLLAPDLLLTISRQPARAGKPQLEVIAHPLRITEVRHRQDDRQTLWEFQLQERDPLRIEGRIEAETPDQAESLARALAASIGWQIGEPDSIASAERHDAESVNAGSPTPQDAARQGITDIWGNPISARKRRRP